MNLIQSTEAILSQLFFVTDRLSKEEFSRPLLSLNNSTIGQHVRHTIEFFQCLLKATETGLVNYDKRDHNKEIESDNEIANNVLTEISDHLSRITGNIDLYLEGSYATDGSDPYKVETNFFRELAYNIEHAVHHMAIIKIGMTEVKPTQELPAHFGVAISTVRYRKQEA